ncbi:Vps72p SKDI_04G6870 [Saccharomyces kudriavzevii IFO 1802]|uniref:VPS72-like protein n=2 Tax=Saccharomyces kudriavzevii (strain ATCC MYA-4449 / AS 2.2408 / CBS 8840 / NBRC 1802 / NCYC 2889) TaxID=226230 RepID=J6EGZ3_SACK1|nr:uncharacterized protein SKDI_04G6870 [Saccharomyces kudriavzevii IFO 1802]EJT43279.1 VPS72-like protein [Saccharomyces kudriavzevii IFO 1802]CAI4059460.1 hypothetical protein SKDI_04G6870 [Saccharomyces kudriavzevii IFO 1802]
MSDESSDNDVGPDTEFIIQTRSRRSNAGNKLQKLLEQELRDIESTKRQLSSFKNDDNEEDEIGLLFQEDDNDEDFEIMEKDAGDEDEGEEEDEAQSITKETPKTSSDHVADDLMFSSSESEDSNNNEDDDDAEEREIRRQELLSRKKRNKKLQKGPVIVKKQKPKAEPVKEQATRKSHHNHEQLNAETLLLNTRRTSKRSSVMENTMKVYEKLSKAEVKRKVIQERIRKHKEQESKYILTQAERLRIAKETEKLNILSLDKFKEKEIWKKENRLALQKRQKQKFQPNETILQFLSTAWLMTPVMELNDHAYWQEQLSKRDKKKKKYPRKPRKNPSPSQQNAQDNKKEESEGFRKDEDSVNPVENESTTLKKQEMIKTGETSPINDAGREGLIPSAAVSTERPEEMKSDPTPGTTLDATADKQNFVYLSCNGQSHEDTVTTAGSFTGSDGIVLNTQIKDIKNELTSISGNAESDSKESLLGDETVSQNDDDDDDDELVKSSQPGSTGTDDNLLITADTEIKEEIAPVEKNENIKDSPRDSSHDIKESSETGTLKQVTFTDSPQVAIIDTEESPSKKTITEVDGSSTEYYLPTPTYEGPEQLISRNFVTLYDFPNTPPNLKDFNTNLFGSQWSHANSAPTTTQRSQNVQTIFHSILPSQSQSAVPSFNVDISLDLSAVANFPSFGEYDKKIVHQISTEANKDLEIKIKTLPPTGVFLANGIRKKCLITNKECQYFDPRTGVPYSDVEAYKIIQRIQDPISKEEERADVKHDETTNDDAVDQTRFKWFGFKNGGIYLDLDQRPAKGVPEEF